ncbi:DUF2491 family protein [Pseudoduganella eburnea]|uniref:DUF2491 family protein n=1 Tax=Massilia eburnea TaxID=1776165 RepID=A0A6L6QIA9_9BURK|nr:DUF2491 family protein [Massilia eburnea]MTW11989.1 DUF2491 family protein [Massilia eburnea]
MGWKDAIDYLRSGAKQRGIGSDAPQQEDRALPLEARIGSLVELQMSPLLRASANGSLVALPQAEDSRILAISQFKLSMAGRLYRYYLAKGDEDDREKFLQLYVDEHGDVKEILYCTQLVRFIPTTVEDQDAFTGSGGSGLGDLQFSLWRSQLEDSGADNEVLATAFGEQEALDFERDAGDPNAGFVPPFTGTETRIDDASGMQGLKQELYFMPYARRLGDGSKEYLLVTTEIVQSVNGDARKRGIHVDFVVGIPVEQERLVIQ